VGPHRGGVAARPARHHPAVLCALALALATAAGPVPSRAPEQVQVHLLLGGGAEGSRAERDRLRDLEYELMARLEASGAGRLVRDEWIAGACVLHLEGRDARALWAAIEADIRALPPRRGSHAILRHADGGEERIPLDAAPR
jgi:hypothetical protein